MQVFNGTDIAIEFRDKVILPGASIDFPEVTGKSSLVGFEKTAEMRGVIALGEVDRPRPITIRRHLPKETSVATLSQIFEK